MLTKDVKFNGQDYKIRFNYKTRYLYAEEIKKRGEVEQSEAIIIYAWCFLRGYNSGFNLSFDDFLMDFDDDNNIPFLDACAEVITHELPNISNEDEGGSDDEKK